MRYSRPPLTTGTTNGEDLNRFNGNPQLFWHGENNVFRTTRQFLWHIAAPIAEALNHLRDQHFRG